MRETVLGIITHLYTPVKIRSETQKIRGFVRCPSNPLGVAATPLIAPPPPPPPPPPPSLPVALPLSGRFRPSRRDAPVTLRLAADVHASSRPRGGEGEGGRRRGNGGAICGYR